MALLTNLDPSVVKSDRFTGNVVGYPGKLPPVWDNLKLKTNLLERYVDLLVGNFENLNEILIASNEDLLEVLESEAMLSYFREEIYNLRERTKLGKGI